MPHPVPRRLGLLGGTFDPPHLGHLAAAQHVLTTLGLDRVDLLVANDPWQKSETRTITPAPIRLEMVRALVEGETGLGADDREIRRGGPTYTSETLEEIHAEHPEVDIFLIVGADTADRISTWHRPEVVRTLSTLVIVHRNGEQTVTTENSDVHVSMEPVNVSSTEIRSCVSRGESIHHLTTPSVVRVIEQRGLYRNAK